MNIENVADIKRLQEFVRTESKKLNWEEIQNRKYAIFVDGRKEEESVLRIFRDYMIGICGPSGCRVVKEEKITPGPSSFLLEPCCTVFILNVNQV